MALSPPRRSKNGDELGSDRRVLESAAFVVVVVVVAVPIVVAMAVEYLVNDEQRIAKDKIVVVIVLDDRDNIFVDRCSRGSCVVSLPQG